MSAQGLVPSASRTRTILLVVSLCVNVALIALVAVGVGRMLGRAMPSPGGGLSPQALLRQASPQERARLEHVLAAHQPAMRAARMAARRARMDALRMFAAPDFSPGAFASSLAAVRAADAALENESITTLGDAVSALTPAERQAIVDRLRMRNRPLWRGLFRLPAPPRMEP